MALYQDKIAFWIHSAAKIQIKNSYINEFEDVLAALRFCRKY